MPNRAQSAGSRGCSDNMSQVDISQQAVSFLLAVALGAAAGVFYCFFCSLRKIGRNRPRQVFFQDIIFWLCLTVATYCLLILRCRGEIRFFVYVGMLLGFCLFRLVLFKYFIAFFSAVFAFLGFAFRPARAMFGHILKLFSALGAKISDFGKKWCKKIKKPRKKVLKATQ